MKKIQVGIIGCGTIANNQHIPSYLNNPDAEIKYFCDIIPERADNAVKKYQYGKGFVKYGVHNKMLSKTEYQFEPTKMFQNEINAFVRCIQTGEKLPSNIDITIKTAKIMEGIYESAKKHKEVEF